MLIDPASISIVSKVYNTTLFVLEIKASFMEFSPDDSLKVGESEATKTIINPSGYLMDEAELRPTYGISIESVSMYDTPEVKDMPVNESIYSTGINYPGASKYTSGAEHLITGHIEADTVANAMTQLRQFKNDLFAPGYRRFNFPHRRSFYAACIDGGLVDFAVTGGYRKSPVYLSFQLNLFEAVFGGADLRTKLYFDGTDQYAKIHDGYLEDILTFDFLVSEYSASGIDYLFHEGDSDSGVYLNNAGKLGVRTVGVNNEYI